MIRKSTLVWLLSDSQGKLSNDRLQRVQAASKTTCKRRLIFAKQISQSKLMKMEEIQIGDWCIFKNSTKDSCSSELLIGQIIGFKYIDGANEKKKRYTWDFAKVKADLPEEKKRGIIVQSSWYQFDFRGKMQRIEKINCFFVNIENYLATLLNIKLEKRNSDLSLSSIYLKHISEDLILLEDQNKSNK